MQGKYPLVSLSLSLIAQNGRISLQTTMGMCTGTHDVTEMISLRQVTLRWWNESMHSSNQCVELVGARCQPSPTIRQRRDKQHKKLA
jgi:hypothetical protein